MLKMTTESPVRLVGNDRSRKWPSSEETMTFMSPSNGVAAQELGMLLSGPKVHGYGQDGVPNRSESAPPSIEGSFAAFGDFFGQQNPSSSSEMSWESLSTMETSDSEEQRRSDPAYVSYYYSNINLNPRLAPPIVSSDTRRLVSRFRDGKKLTTSFDDSNNESLIFSRSALSTHKEEPEEERPSIGNLVKHSHTNSGERTRDFLLGRYSDASTGRHKSLVDLIQADFPRTPSPVYNQPPSTNVVFEESPSSDSHPNLLHDSLSKTPELIMAGGAVHTTASILSVNVAESMSDKNNLLSDTPSASSSQDRRDLNLLSGAKGNLNCTNSHSEDASVHDGSSNSEAAGTEVALRGLTISDLPNASDFKRQEEWRNSQRSNSVAHHSQSQSVSTSQGRRQSQSPSQGQNLVHVGIDQPLHGNSKVSSAQVQAMEVQPVLQGSGIAPQLYAAATAYMAPGCPFYHNLQPANIYASHYNLGAYALNAAVLHPLLAGYAPQRFIPVTYDNSVSANFHARAAGVPSGPNIGTGIGQFGLQPSYGDPLLYLPLPMDDTYNAGIQYDPMPYRGGSTRNQIESFDAQKGPPLAAYNTDQKSRPGAIPVPNSRKGAFPSAGYYGSPPGMGLAMPFPTSPIGSPSFAGTSIAGTNILGRQNDSIRFPVGSSRNLGAHSGWQGSKGNDKINDSRYSFLEELKSSKARRFELSDIAGRIVEFSADQHGSRFIQQKLERCSAEEKALVFEEVLPHASALMTDVFGNYVIQKFFEYGSAEQRKELAKQLTGHVLPLSLQMYGCRVIQKALEVVELDQKAQLVMELDGHVMQCVRDQNGNHVIQKCIECVPAEKIEFITSAFHGQVFTLSRHPYGCRVIQRVLEHCTDEKQSHCIIDEILQSACVLAQDQYGNYVTQHVLEKGKPVERSKIINKLAGQVVQLSQHKYASNVIEKCLEHGDPIEREFLIDEILGQTEGNDNLLTMMKDQFANYVVQKILETCNDQQREILLNRMRVHLHALKKYTYGKHIVARVEQLLPNGETTISGG